MKVNNDIMVQIQVFKERGYVKFYIKHPQFTGRIKKHVGKGEIEDFNGFKIQLQNDLEVFFAKEVVTKDILSAYVDDAVRKLKFGHSIFDYVDEFIEEKIKTINRKTKKPLSQSSINSYIRAIELFQRMLIEKSLRPIPEIINDQLLNEFMSVRKRLSYNYMVKLHTRLKSFIKFLEYRNLPIDKSYNKSTFNEQYDNQEPDGDDIALTVDEVNKIILLREKYRNNLIHLPEYKKAKTLSKELQSKQRNKKLANLRRTLDCFLFMVSTGMYISDVNESSLQIFYRKSNSYLRYRRTKNNSLCKAIPLDDYECFIGQTIIREYGIKPGDNFPLNLTVNTFNKHLKVISEQVGFSFVLKSKMARKTFATLNHFDFEVQIDDIQKMLGHKDVEQTLHYLRIEDDELATRIQNRRIRAG